MKRTRVLLVEDSERLRAWLSQVRSAGLRYGWLHLEAGDVVGRLAAEGDATALRTVYLTHSGSVAIKPRTRPSPLRDLLREHFLGCQLVLMARDPAGPFGEQERAWLEACGQEVVALQASEGQEWQVRSLAGEVVLRGDDERICRALRRPRWLPLDED